MKTPQESEFKLIESFDNSELVYPGEIPTFNHDCIIDDIINKRIFLWLKYPDEINVVMAFSETVSLDNFAIDMMYHLLFPIVFEISPVKWEGNFSLKKPEDILLLRLACYLRQSYSDIDTTI